jgi:cytochrome c oxidase cbb3-type subunit 3
MFSALAVCSCKREERGFRVEAPSANSIETVRLSELLPGPSSNEIASQLSSTNLASTNSAAISTNALSAVRMNPTNSHTKNPYEENAYALSEGQRSYTSFNCSGCHAHGGGGIGPALMDDKWIYGHEPAQIFATIVQGRPNGMPSFQNRIPDYQVWQIAAYVRSLSGLVPRDAAPGRTDHMKGKPPENSKDPEKPVNSSSPK